MLAAYSTAVAVLVAVSAITLFRAAFLYHPTDSVGSSLHVLALMVPAALVLLAGLVFGADLQTSALLGLVAAAPFFLCLIAAVPVAAIGLFKNDRRTWPQRALFALGVLTTLTILWVVLFASMH